MPEIDAELKGERPGGQFADARMWWDRGYDVRGSDSTVVCFACGSTVPTNIEHPVNGPYWEVHDEWHDFLEGAAEKGRETSRKIPW